MGIRRLESCGRRRSFGKGGLVKKMHVLVADRDDVVVKRAGIDRCRVLLRENDADTPRSFPWIGICPVDVRGQGAVNLPDAGGG